jgi:hypothetical protein
MCEGSDLDNTYKFPTDWSDVCGTSLTFGTPLVSAPSVLEVDEQEPLNFTVFATDPDGDAITNLSAMPLPTGAMFEPSVDNTEGSFSWTPGFMQSGSYNVTFTASNALAGSATTGITVRNVNLLPIVTAPSSVSGPEGSVLTFGVTASDPDGDAMTSLSATGSAVAAGGTFAANPANTSGTFSWTPGFTQAGSYSVQIAGKSACRATEVSSPWSAPP